MSEFETNLKTWDKEFKKEESKKRRKQKQKIYRDKYKRRLKLAGLVRKSYRVPEEYEQFFRNQVKKQREKYADQINDRLAQLRKFKGLI